MILTDGSPWEERAAWWSPDWPYRLAVDVTAGLATRDAVVTIPINWPAVWAALGVAGPVDLTSLRLVEYTPGGHVQDANLSSMRHASLSYQRFDRAPCAPRNGDLNSLVALIPCDLDAGATRRFFLYFDSAAHTAYDCKLLTVTNDGSGLTVARTGPDTEVTPTAQPINFPLAGGWRNTTFSRTFGLPLYDVTALVTGAVYTVTDQTAMGAATAVLTGPNITGSAQYEVDMQFVPNPVFGGTCRLGAYVRGTITLSRSVDLAVTAGKALHLLTEACGGVPTDAWIGGGAPLGVGVRTPLSEGTEAVVVQSSMGALRIDSLDAIPPVFGDAANLTVIRPAAATLDIDLVAPGNGTWHAGEDLRFSFTTYTVFPDTATPAWMSDTLMGARDANLTVTVGSTPAAYSSDLQNAQYCYYEGKGWDFVEHSLMAYSWGQADDPTVDWNFAYSYQLTDPTMLDWTAPYVPDPALGTFQPCHDNDQSMGAGFLLYAASLKAAQTGESRYYTIADAYARYFLELNARDIADHPSPPHTSCVGRISYGFNGSPVNTWTIGGNTAPPLMTMDRSSVDQCMTAALGMIAYVLLDPAKIAHRDAVVTLLGQVAHYLLAGDPTHNVAADDALMNVGMLLSLPGFTTWYAHAQASEPVDGDEYAKWLAGATCNVNTGNDANNLAITLPRDRMLAHKDPTLLHNFIKYIASDTGVAVREWYPTIAASWTAAWGQASWEFPRGAMLKSLNNGLIYDGGVPTSHRVYNGGLRDSLSGRMAEHLAWLIMGLGEYPTEFLPAQGVPNYESFSSWVRDALHAEIAFLMHDSGGMYDQMMQVLGHASAVIYTNMTADFSGYFLTAMAFYHAIGLKDCPNITPVSGYQGYVQGVAEAGGVTTITYLGDAVYSQVLQVPHTDRPVLCGGSAGWAASPALTFGPTGEAAELAGNTLTLPVTMTAHVVGLVTVRQLPVGFAPAAGTVVVTPEAWDPATGGNFSLSAAASVAVTVTAVTTAPAGSIALLSYGGALVGFATVDGSGSLTATVTIPAGAGQLDLTLAAPETILVPDPTPLTDAGLLWQDATWPAPVPTVHV